MSRRRAAVLTLVATAAAVGTGAGPAAAAPADVQVRIEGRTATLYDRTIHTDVRTVRALSDPVARTCDSTNNGMHPTPSPTATSASVDAMSRIGQGFDGEWYDGFDDYFIKQFGPDREGETYWWGILVNDDFTPVGGCQYPVATGDRVLWVNDAFNGRPFLWLSGPATAVVGQPVTVGVGTSTPDTSAPDPTVDPYDGATVGGVTLAAQPTAAGIVTPGATGASGDATVVFHQTGWQRLKARTVAPDGDSSPPAIASNSIDVCVTPVGGGTCGGPPPGTVPDVVPDPDPPETTPTTPTTTTTTTTTTDPVPTVTTPPKSDPAPSPAVRLSLPVVATTGGRVGLRWTVLDPGVGVRDWAVEAQATTPATASWMVAARGTTATAASLSLVSGRTYRLRLRVTDGLGRESVGDVGRVLVPVDDRSGSLAYGRGWRRAPDAGAWAATVTRGTARARVTARLAAGRPVVVVRSGRRAARIAVTAAGRTQTFAISSSRTPRTRTVTARRRAKSGAVTVRVTRGTAALDGVALAP